MTAHRMHGLVLASDIPLSHDRPAEASAPIDVHVALGGSREVPGSVEEGETLQSVADYSSGMLYSTVRRPDGTVLLRVHRHVDFEISPDRTSVTTWVDPGSDLEMTGIFVSGLLVSVLLMLAGDPVLHASAVEVDGRAVAFVANSGMGKSTLAALACTRGARFVTDDVLRLADESGALRCWLGATDNRLRRDSREISQAYEALSTRMTVDGRSAIRPPASTHELSELCSVVLPVADRTADGLLMTRLSAPEAIVAMTRHPRIQGWQDAQGRRALFARLARIAATTPVFSARVPWGPPFEPTTIDALLEGAGVSPVRR